MRPLLASHILQSAPLSHCYYLPALWRFLSRFGQMYSSFGDLGFVYLNQRWVAKYLQRP